MIPIRNKQQQFDKVQHPFRSHYINIPAQHRILQKIVTVTEQQPIADR